MSRTNYTVANAIGNWFLFTDSSSTFRRIYPGALAFHTFRNSDGALESAQWAAWVQWDTKRGGGGWVEPKVFHENVATPFRIGKSVLIPAGEYDFADLQIALSMAQGRKLLTGVDFRTGTYFDGTRTQVLLRPRWNVSPHLELGGDYQLSHLSFPSRSQDANVQLARLRVRSALDARLSGNALVQYSSTNERLDFNARVRYAFGEGTDLWLVFNEGLDTDRDVDLVGNRTPRSLARTFIVKYTHTLAF